MPVWVRDLSIYGAWVRVNASGVGACECMHRCIYLCVFVYSYTHAFPVGAGVVIRASRLSSSRCTDRRSFTLLFAGLIVEETAPAAGGDGDSDGDGPAFEDSSD